MSELVNDCPRCGAARMTFDLIAATVVGVKYGWQQWYEAFCTCRHCGRSTVFVLAEKGIDEGELIRQKGLAAVAGSVNGLVRLESYVSLKDKAGTPPPDHVPNAITDVFVEGTTCIAVGCFNAAATMFRLCIDLATKSLLPQADTNGLNSKIRRNLGLRLPWLFDHNLLPGSLRELSTCIKEDGNDGAHDGTLKEEDAEDVLDFTVALLERLYTEPERLRVARERRDKRRGG